MTGMGLGSKSPFAYTDVFTAVSRHNGKRYHFSCALENGKPNITQFPALDMEDGEETGLEIAFNVNRGDISTFIAKTEQLYRWFTAEVKFYKDGQPMARPPVKYDLKYEQGVAIANRYELGENSERRLLVHMGGVMYGVDLPEFNTRNFPLTREQYDSVVHAHRNMGNGAFVVKAEVGDVDVAASREHCELTTRTIHFVLSKLYNYLESVEREFLAELDKQNLTDMDYCVKYANFLENKPFLSHKGLDSKISACFNMCVYTDLECVNKSNTQCEWSVIWSAQQERARKRSELKYMPRTLTSHVPSGSCIRYGNSKLAAMRAVSKGKIKFLQVPETRKSASFPPRTLEYFGDDAEIIMIRDDKQCDYLRTIGLKVVTIADLPKPEPVVRTSTKTSSGDKPQREGVQKLLATYRLIHHVTFKGFSAGSALIYDTTYLGSADQAYWERVEDAVKEDKLIIIPTHKPAGTTKLYAHADWVDKTLCPALGFKLGTSQVHANFNYLLRYLHDLGYVMVTKSTESSDTTDITASIQKLEAKLGISSAVNTIAKAVKGDVLGKAELLKALQLHILEDWCSLHTLAVKDVGKIPVALQVLPSLAMTKKYQKLLAEYAAKRVAGKNLNEIAKLMVSSWYQIEANTRSSLFVTSRDYSDVWLPAVPGIEDTVNELQTINKVCLEAFPLINSVCNWESGWLRQFSWLLNFRNKDHFSQYIDGMVLYHRKNKTNFNI